jgi:hypothetical protein
MTCIAAARSRAKHPGIAGSLFPVVEPNAAGRQPATLNWNRTEPQCS